MTHISVFKYKTYAEGKSLGDGVIFLLFLSEQGLERSGISKAYSSSEVFLALMSEIALGMIGSGSPSG